VTWTAARIVCETAVRVALDAFHLIGKRKILGGHLAQPAVRVPRPVPPPAAAKVKTGTENMICAAPA